MVRFTVAGKCERDINLQNRCESEMDWACWRGGGCYMYNSNVSDSDERFYFTLLQKFSFLFYSSKWTKTDGLDSHYRKGVFTRTENTGDGRLVSAVG